MRESDTANLTAVSDASDSEVVIALSRVSGTDQSKSKGGELLRMVSVKHSAQIDFDQAAIQQFINESHSIFCRAQTLYRTSTITTSDILSLSLEYRSALRSAVETLTEADETESRDMLSSWEIVWSLVEAIFIKPTDSSVVFDLITWARLYITKTPFTEEIAECFRTGKINRLNKENFWQQVVCFVLCGLFANAVKFLDKYGTLANDRSALNLARAIDDLNVDLLNDPNTVWDFVKYQQEVRSLVDSGHFGSSSEARLIARLISGDIAVLKRVIPLLRSWVELMPAYLLFFKPRANLANLREAATECVAFFKDTEDGDLELIARKIFSLDALGVLKQITDCTSNWWLAAHLADLLQKADLRTVIAHGIDARQFLVIEYGSQLFSIPGFWRVGFDYLRECSTEGMDKIEMLLPTVSLKNDDVASKLFTLCDECGLCYLKVDIARSRALRLIKMDNWGTALTWAIRSEDIELIESVAKQTLAHCTPETISKVVVLNELTETLLRSPSLVFLHKYLQFRNLLELAEKSKAAELLVELITSAFAPPAFRKTLFDHLLGILDCSASLDKVFLSKDGTYRLLQYLAVENRPFGADISEEFSEGKVSTINFALLNNLTSAIVMD